MDSSLPLTGFRFCIAGSAGDTDAGKVDRALVRQCHVYVSCLAISILRAGGELVAFVGDEKLLDPEDPSLAKVFFWTQLESVASCIPTRSMTHSGRFLLHAVTSLDPDKRRIPEHRQPLWAQLLEAEGAMDVNHVPERAYVGHHHRERQAERADVLIALGGGKGIFEQTRLFRERGSAILPLDPRIGCSCNDGEASPVLNREALAQPEQFVPAELATWFVPQLTRLSFSGGTSPEELARRTMQVLVRVAPAVEKQRSRTRGLPGPRSIQSPQPSKSPAARPVLGDVVHFLVLADEWRPHRGGISTFNRDFCLALARAGHRVSLFVPRKNMHADDRAEIAAVPGMQLVGSSQGYFTDERELLLLPALDSPPDVIVGHGAITGPMAQIQRLQFGNSLVVHFIHVSPKDAENEKGNPQGEAMVAAENKDRDQADLAGEADLVVALGPLLARSIRSSLREWKRTTAVHEMLPWVQDLEMLDPPEVKACVFVGRAESFHLKGLAIAAGAVARLGERPILYIRGVSQDRADELHEQLREWSAGRITQRLQGYSVDPRSIDASFRAATAALMPSRTEGFGLAGLEAISRGIPVRVSDQSGLGEVLKEYGGVLGTLAVVEFDDESRDEKNIARFHEKLVPIWNDPQTAFDQARKLREVLLPQLNEQKSIAAFIEALRSLSRQTPPQ